MTAWVAQVNDCLTGISKIRNSIGEDYTAWNHVRRIINGLIQRVVFVRLVPIYIATCVVPHTSGGIIYSSKKSNTSKERNCNFLLKKPLQGIVVRITPPVGVVEPSPGRYRFFDSRDHKTPGYACYLWVKQTQPCGWAHILFRLEIKMLQREICFVNASPLMLKLWNHIDLSKAGTRWLT